MPRIHHAEQALTLLKHSTRSHYVCRACRAHAIRQIHTTRALQVEDGFFQRIRKSLFGSKEAKAAAEEAAKQREEKAGELARTDAARSTVQVKTDRKGRRYEVAAVVDSSVNTDYVAATTWDGLKRIGGDQWVKAQMDKGEPYIGFMPEKRAKLKDEQWRRLIHHVAVEMLVLQKAGRNVKEIYLPRDKDATSWRYTQNAKITLEDGVDSASVTFKSANAEQMVLLAISRSAVQNPPVEEAGMAETSSDGRSQTLRDILAQALPPDASTAPTWMAVPIKEPLVKLAIIKRIMQLTGHRLSDPILSKVTTLTDLYNVLKAPEPPKKLSETPELQMLQGSAPNIRVHARRQTPIHKEKAVGRWKLIEKELIARDLPVTGRRWRDAKPRIGHALER